MISVEHSQTRAQRLKFLAAVYLLWAGLILGISFIATPIKFHAPHLTFAIALEIGKVTFHFFSKIELILLVVAALLAAFSRTKWQPWILLVPLGLLILSQKFWLLPALDIRTDMVIAGGHPSSGYLHWIYVVLECLKLVLLLIGAKAAAKNSLVRKGTRDR